MDDQHFSTNRRTRVIAIVQYTIFVTVIVLILIFAGLTTRALVPIGMILVYSVLFLVPRFRRLVVDVTLREESFSVRRALILPPRSIRYEDVCDFDYTDGILTITLCDETSRPLTIENPTERGYPGQFGMDLRRVRAAIRKRVNDLKGT